MAARHIGLALLVMAAICACDQPRMVYACWHTLDRSKRPYRVGRGRVYDRCGHRDGSLRARQYTVDGSTAASGAHTARGAAIGQRIRR